MKKLFAAVAVFGVLSASSASAAVVGTFNFNGLDAVAAAVGDTYIDFGNPFSYMASGCDNNIGTPCLFAPGVGSIEINGSTGWFDPPGPATANGTGVVRDLVLSAQTPGVPFVLPNFLVLNNAPQFNFTLTGIDVPGFVLTPIGGSTLVGFAGTGIVTGGPSPATFRVTFTTQFNETPQSLLARVEDETPALNTYSATVTVDVAQVPVPEPASLALMGLALSGMAVAIRRRRKQ